MSRLIYRVPAVLMLAFLALLSLSSAYASPPGANDWNCQPSPGHPRPVVLVHGTFENMDNNWTLLSAALKSNGYCVFALNYGASFFSFGVFYGLAAVESSAAELSIFVDKVLTETGAGKVDIVGHSQGGMMPRYYIKSLNGAGKVGALVGIASSNHGTSWSGLATLADNFPPMLSFARLLGAGISRTFQEAFGIIAPSTTDQTVGSAFLAELNEGGDTYPGITYTVIATRFDEVVTPYQSAFLSGPSVTNILLQDQCAADSSEHITAATADGLARRNVLNALDPAHAVPATCSDL